MDKPYRLTGMRDKRAAKTALVCVVGEDSQRRSSMSPERHQLHETNLCQCVMGMCLPFFFLFFLGSRLVASFLLPFFSFFLFLRGSTLGAAPIAVSRAWFAVLAYHRPDVSISLCLTKDQRFLLQCTSRLHFFARCVRCMRLHQARRRSKLNRLISMSKRRSRRSAALPCPADLAEQAKILSFSL